MSSRRAVQWLGALTGVVFVAGGLLVATTYRSLREGPLPVILLADVVLVAVILLAALRLRLGWPRRLALLGSALAMAGLAVVVVFFVAVVVLEGFTDRVPEWMASLGTFLGSAAALIAVPVGLLLVGLAALGERRLPGWGRPLPMVATLCFLAAPVSIALIPEGRLEGQVPAWWGAASGIAWAGFVFGMASTLPAAPGASRRTTSS